MSEDLPIVTVDRFRSDDDGTRSYLRTPLNLFECCVGELPYRDVDGDGVTDRGLSCVPRGDYYCEFVQSPSRKNADGSFEWTYRLRNVPGRDGVLIHSGNFFGDKKKGRVAQVEGCLVLGRAFEEIEIPAAVRDKAGVERTRQLGVTSSRSTVQEFVKMMECKPFILRIRGTV